MSTRSRVGWLLVGYIDNLQKDKTEGCYQAVGAEIREPGDLWGAYKRSGSK